MQYAALQALMPTLCPRIQPRSLVDSDMDFLLRHASTSTQEDFRKHLLKLSELPVSQKCGLCGTPGKPSVGHICTPGAQQQIKVDDKSDGREAGHHGERADADTKLHLTLLWQLDFVQRACRIKSPTFCCRTCRACLDTGSMLRLAALHSGSRNMEPMTSAEMSKGCGTVKPSSLCQPPSQPRKLILRSE
jgi:hypothetical protein